MGRPKGRISDTENIGSRMPIDLINQMDAYAQVHKSSRSGVINQAIGDLVGSVECIKCGARNNGKGKVCSVCGSELFADEEIEKTILEVTNALIYDDKDGILDYPEFVISKKLEAMDIYKNSKKYDGLGLKIITQPILDRTMEPTRYAAGMMIKTPDGDILVPKNGGLEISYDADAIYYYTKKSCGVIPENIEENLTHILGKERIVIGSKTILT